MYILKSCVFYIFNIYTIIYKCEIRRARGRALVFCSHQALNITASVYAIILTLTPATDCRLVKMLNVLAFSFKKKTQNKRKKLFESLPTFFPNNCSVVVLITTVRWVCAFSKIFCYCFRSETEIDFFSSVNLVRRYLYTIICNTVL